VHAAELRFDLERCDSSRSPYGAAAAARVTPSGLRAPRYSERPSRSGAEGRAARVERARGGPLRRAPGGRGAADAQRAAQAAAARVAVGDGPADVHGCCGTGSDESASTGTCELRARHPDSRGHACPSVAAMPIDASALSCASPACRGWPGPRSIRGSSTRPSGVLAAGAEPCALEFGQRGSGTPRRCRDMLRITILYREYPPSIA
jgi:hypothetical protein